MKVLHLPTGPLATNVWVLGDERSREALASLETGDPAYSTALNDIAVSNGQLATEGTLLFTRVRSEVHAVLTDEQRDKLARGKERMRQAFEHKARGR